MEREQEHKKRSTNTNRNSTSIGPVEGVYHQLFNFYSFNFQTLRGSNCEKQTDDIRQDCVNFATTDIQNLSHSIRHFTSGLKWIMMDNCPNCVDLDFVVAHKNSKTYRLTGMHGLIHVSYMQDLSSFRGLAKRSSSFGYSSSTFSAPLLFDFCPSL